MSIASNYLGLSFPDTFRNTSNWPSRTIPAFRSITYRQQLGEGSFLVKSTNKQIPLGFLLLLFTQQDKKLLQHYDLLLKVLHLVRETCKNIVRAIVREVRQQNRLVKAISTQVFLV